MTQRNGMPQTELSRWSAELQILLRCGQAQDSVENEAQIDALLDGNLGWERVLRGASLLGMLPLLHAKLGLRAPDEVPAEVRDLLRRHCMAMHVRNLQSLGDLFALLDLFAAKGISVMPFKGPVLATQAYGNLGLRPFADLDLLVRPHDVPAACDLMLARGYSPRYVMNSDQRAHLLRFGCELPFQRLHAVQTRTEGTDVSGEPRKDNVDLHWDLFPPSFPIVFDSETLWNRVETVTVARRKIVTIGTDMLILYLCAHGYAHHWSRLEWICALARLITVRSDIDWGWIQREARRRGAERVLELGVVLAGDWLGAPVPGDLLADARRRPAMKTLIDHVAARILRDPAKMVVPESTLNEEMFFDLDASENWRRRISYFLRRLVTPSLEDVEWVSMPACLPAAYYVLRPVRLSLRRLSLRQGNSVKLSEDKIAPGIDVR